MKTIEEARKAKGMTQMDLAVKMSVSDKAVSKWEAGEGNPLLGHSGSTFWKAVTLFVTVQRPMSCFVF